MVPAHHSKLEETQQRHKTLSVRMNAMLYTNIYKCKWGLVNDMRGYWRRLTHGSALKISSGSL